jgi:hypothetical protein
MHVHRDQALLGCLSSFVCVWLLASSTAVAQDKSPAPAKPIEAQSYRSGLKSIVLPPPTTDLNEMGSDYRVLVESMVPDTNRLLAAFVSAEDLANVRSGVSKPLVRYALVENLRRAEFADISADIFKQVSDGVAQQAGVDLSASTKDNEEELNHKLKAMLGSNTTVALEKPVPVGAFFSKPNACGFGMIESL